jgi:hypothetical protein
MATLSTIHAGYRVSDHSARRGDWYGAPPLHPPATPKQICKGRAAAGLQLAPQRLTEYSTFLSCITLRGNPAERVAENPFRLTKSVAKPPGLALGILVDQSLLPPRNGCRNDASPASLGVGSSKLPTLIRFPTSSESVVALAWATGCRHPAGRRSGHPFTSPHARCDVALASSSFVRKQLEAPVLTLESAGPVSCMRRRPFLLLDSPDSARVGRQ